MNKKVTVVIPTRNEEDYISKCLDSFLNQSYPKEYYEVFVCDGGSKDNTVNIIKEYEQKYKMFKYINNPGITMPKGVNLGIKNSNADIIILFGAHAYAQEDFIKNNVKKHEEYQDVGCVGGPIETINTDDKGKAISYAISSPFGVGNALFRYAEKETYVDTVAFGAYKKEIFNKIGLLDEELTRNQDDELNLRVTKNGYKILLTPQVRSYYYSRSSYKKLWTQYFQYGFWKVRVIQKHKQIIALRHLIPVIFVLFNLFGIIGGVLNKLILSFWLSILLIYFILDLVVSYKATKTNKRIFKYMPITFPILHLSYGIGFLNGLVNFYIIKSRKVIDKNTRLSR